MDWAHEQDSETVVLVPELLGTVAGSVSATRDESTSCSATRNESVDAQEESVVAAVEAATGEGGEFGEAEVCTAAVEPQPEGMCATTSDGNGMAARLAELCKVAVAASDPVCEWSAALAMPRKQRRRRLFMDVNVVG
jgi:hypothetical protein